MFMYADDYFDGRNNLCEAVNIGSKNGVINHPNDLDVFKFTTTQQGSHLFQINGAVGTLMDASGSVLAETSQGVASYSLTEGAVYYFKVSASGTATGAYTLHNVPYMPGCKFSGLDCFCTYLCIFFRNRHHDRF